MTMKVLSPWRTFALAGLLCLVTQRVHAEVPSDRYRDADILSMEETTVDAGRTIRRHRLIRTEFKYPLLQVEDTLERTPPTGRETIVAQRAMVADHIMVKLRPGVGEADLRAFARTCQGHIRRKLHTPGLYLVAFTNCTLETVMHGIEACTRAHAITEYAEPDYIVTAADTEPDDPGYSQLWGIPKIDAPAAWDLHTGTVDTVIGIIDSGVDYNHPDLAANRWTNPGEVAGNGVDDDGNGFVDDVYGWDFHNNDSDPRDDNDHGSHVAGTIGAVGDNATGVVGVNWRARLMAIKFLDAVGNGSMSDAIDSIQYAVMMRQRGVNVCVINASWGGGGSSGGLEAALSASRDADILFVAAAGNYGSNNDASPYYPASIDLDNVIAVAATDGTDARAAFSNYGVTSVDLGAPGVSIYSTTRNGGYGWKSGTSMATPHVVGAAALLWDFSPASTYAQIRDALLQGVDVVSGMQGKVKTGGRLNVNSAIFQLSPGIKHIPPTHQTNTNSLYALHARITPRLLLETNSLQVLWTAGMRADAFSTNTLTWVEGNTFCAPIATQAVGTVVSYYLYARTQNGLWTVHPSNAPAALHSFHVSEMMELTVTGMPFNVGHVTPDYGGNQYPSGVVVQAAAPAYLTVTNGERYACSGWTGSGSVPSTGPSTELSLRMEDDSVLSWQWAQEYALAQMSSIPDVVGTTTWWAASSLAGTILADQQPLWTGTNYHFVEWRIDGARQPDPTNAAVNPVLGIHMDRARQGQAIYLPEGLDADGDGMDDWWERRHFGSTNVSATADFDGDGFSNVLEFLDQTDPRDVQSLPSPPSITHLGLAAVVDTPAPWPISATVTDNHAVAEARLWWNRNSNGWQNTVMTPIADGNQISAIPQPGTTGDVFAYYIAARDDIGLTVNTEVQQFSVEYAVVSHTPAALSPITIPPGVRTNRTIAIANSGNADYLWYWAPDFMDDVESGANGWILAGSSNIWHIGERRFRSPTHAWYLGNESLGKYTPSLQAELRTPPIQLSQSPVLTYWQWIASELHQTRPGYAWDGGIVEISTDGGAFAQITPIGGYPYRIDRWQAPQFPANTPCFAGTGGWEQITFDLSDYENQEVTIRFHFTGDNNTQREGWYIDDLYVSSSIDTNHWFYVSPTNGVLRPSGGTNIVVTFDSTDIPTGDFESLVRLRGNAPSSREIEIPLSMRVRSNPVAEVTSATQTSVSGEGFVTIGVNIFDADGETCEMEVTYSDGGAWTGAWIHSASSSLGTVEVVSNETGHVEGIMTESGWPPVSNALQVVWDTQHAPGIVLTSNAQIRVRVWDGLYWSRDTALTESATFLVDNEAPTALPWLLVPSHDMGTWSTKADVKMTWGTSSDGMGVGGIRYAGFFTNDISLLGDGAFETPHTYASHRLHPDGTNWWVLVQPLDAYGNTGPVSRVGELWIDSTPPDPSGATITVERSEYGDYVVSQTLHAEWSGFSDNLSGITNYYVSLQDGGGTPFGLATKQTSAWLWGVKQDQTNTVYVWARDRAGSIGEAAVTPVLVLNPATDFDGDGHTTAQEETAGTDASSDQSVLAFDAAAVNDPYVVLTWPSVSGRLYTVYQRPALTGAPDWAPTDFTNMPGAEGTLSYTTSVHGVTTRFYRIGVRR